MFYRVSLPIEISGFYAGLAAFNAVEAARSVKKIRLITHNHAEMLLPAAQALHSVDSARGEKALGALLSLEQGRGNSIVFGDQFLNVAPDRLRQIVGTFGYKSPNHLFRSEGVVIEAIRAVLGGVSSVDESEIEALLSAAGNLIEPRDSEFAERLGFVDFATVKQLRNLALNVGRASWSKEKPEIGDMLSSAYLYIADLCMSPRAQILESVSGMDEQSLDIVEEVLKSVGLTFGMKLHKVDPYYLGAYAMSHQRVKLGGKILLRKLLDDYAFYLPITKSDVMFLHSALEKPESESILISDLVEFMKKDPEDDNADVVAGLSRIQRMKTAIKILGYKK